MRLDLDNLTLCNRADPPCDCFTQGFNVCVANRTSQLDNDAVMVSEYWYLFIFYLGPVSMKVSNGLYNSSYLTTPVYVYGLSIIFLLIKVQRRACKYHLHSS